MIMSNKFLTLCLFGLALLIGACCAAELPTDPVAISTTTVGPKTIGREIDDDIEWLDGQEDEEEDDDDYEEEYEDEYDMGIGDSPEEDLAELSAEHFEVKEDCAELASMIEEAKTSNSTVDPNLQQAYDQCEQDLKDIESDMQTLSSQITRKD